MASIKRASNRRLREIEYDIRGLMWDREEPRRLHGLKNSLSEIEHEEFQRGDEV